MTGGVSAPGRRADERCLVIADAGRGLAVAAGRAGLVPIVIDRCGDTDAREAAERWAGLPTACDGTIDGQALLHLAQELAPPPAPLLWGACLEGQPHLLTTLAEGRAAAGTPAASVRRLKDPSAFAALCAAAGVAHPETRDASLEPATPGWLLKRRGAAGGTHVRRAGKAERGPLDYAQREIVGEPASLTFLATCDGIAALAFCRPWLAPTRHAPWRFGGLVAPARRPAAQEAVMRRAACAVAAEAGVRGLASADFVIDGAGRAWLLEINPRPGASLEPLERLAPEGLMASHLAASADLPISAPALREGACALAYLYAPALLDVPTSPPWPRWVLDRPWPGSIIAADEAVCTVVAQGVGETAARALLAERMRSMTGLLRRWAVAGTQGA